MCLQAELIRVGFIQIALKTAEVFTCLGSLTQPGHSIIRVTAYNVNVSGCKYQILCILAFKRL